MLLAGRRTYYDAVASLLRQYVGYYLYDGNLRFTQRLSSEWHLAVTGFLNTDRVPPDRGESGLFKWGNRAATISLRWQRQQLHWHNQISFAAFRIAAEDTSNALQIQNRLNDFGWRSELEYYAPRTSVLAGTFAKRLRFRYRWEEGSGDDLEEIFYAGVPDEFQYRREQFLFGGFVEFTHRLHTRMTFRGGVRFSNRQSGTTQLLPRVSAQYDWPRVGQWRLSFGQNAQWQASGREGIEGNIGSPSFPLPQPLLARMAALSFERTLPGNFAFSVEAYSRRATRVARLSESNYPAFEFGRGTTNGLEIFAARERGRVTLQASYSWMKTLHTFCKETYPPDWDVRHSFTGLFGTSLGKGFSAHFAMLWHSGAPFTPYAAHAPLLQYLGSRDWEWWWEALPGTRNSGRLPAYWRADFLKIRSTGLLERWHCGTGRRVACASCIAIASYAGLQSFRNR